MGANCLPRRKWLELLDRVRSGATLYISLDDGIVPDFNAVAGVEVVRRAKAAGPRLMRLANGGDIGIASCDDINVVTRSAKVLGRSASDGAPLFWRNDYGRGVVYVLASPMEDQLTRTPRVFLAGNSHWHIYREVIADLPSSRRLRIDDPFIAHSEHHLGDGRRVACLINHSPETRTIAVGGAAGDVTCLRGTLRFEDSRPSVTIGSFDAALILTGGDAEP